MASVVSALTEKIVAINDIVVIISLFIITLNKVANIHKKAITLLVEMDSLFPLLELNVYDFERQV
jgi:hypothetical protein